MKAMGLAVTILLFASRCCLLSSHHIRTEPHEPTAKFAQAANAPMETFSTGDGPPLILLHELPGPSGHFVDLMERLASQGYTVYAPVMFGTFGGKRLGGATMLSRCASRDFNCRKNELSPISAKIRELADFVHGRHQGERLGVIGMCLTGNLPLAVGDKPYVGAVVLSQPALPLSIGSWKHRTGLSQNDIDAVRKDLPMMALGFTEDCIGPPERLAALKRTFPDLQVVPVTASSEDYHAVLTDALDHPGARKACEDVVHFLNRHVKGTPTEGSIDACDASH